MRPVLFSGSAFGVSAATPIDLFAPNNIFQRDMTEAARAGSNELALKLANQMHYSDPAYSYNGEAAPNFYGAAYAGGKIPAATSSGRTYMSLSTPSSTFFFVTSATPRVKVKHVNEKGEELPEAEGSGLGAAWNSVPVPPAATIAAKHIADPNNSDKGVTIINLDTSEMWEFWKFTCLGAEETGPFTARWGGYYKGLNSFSGVWPNNWGIRATSLAMLGGMLMWQDIINVLLGGEINHAIALVIPVTGPGWVEPATRSDYGAGTYNSLIPELYEGAANPGYPHVDAVPEGTFVTFPAASKASEYPALGTIAKAVYEAVRKYGAFVCDNIGPRQVAIPLESQVDIGSPYAWSSIDPTYGAPADWRFQAKEWSPKSWEDKALPLIEEELGGSGSFVPGLPWKTLETLAPFLPPSKAPEEESPPEIE